MRKRYLSLILGGMILALFLIAAVFPTVFTPYGQKEVKVTPLAI